MGTITVKTSTDLGQFISALQFFCELKHEFGI